MNLKSNLKKIQLIFLVLISMFVFQACINGNINKGPVSATKVEIVNTTKTVEIYVGEELELSAKVLPKDASDKVIWKSSNSSIASVNSGLVTALKAGTVTITAESATKKSVKSTITLTIIDFLMNITEIVIEGYDSVYIDDIIRLKYKSTPETTNLKVKWESSNDEIATISQYGELRGLVPGDVTISINYGDELSYTKQIEVKPRVGEASEISLVGLTKLEVGQKSKLYVNTLPLGAVNNVNYVSSNEEVATVNNLGIVEALSGGEVTISAISVDNPIITTEIKISVSDYRIDQGNFLSIFNKVIKNSKDSIFGIVNKQYDSVGKPLYNIGSGVIYKVLFEMKDGTIVEEIDGSGSHFYEDVKIYHYYMLTNKHVVEAHAELSVYIHLDGLDIPARLEGTDEKIDIAVISFEDDVYHRPLGFADISKLEAGEFVIAMGNPEGLEYYSTATQGIVSYPLRYIKIDTDNDSKKEPDWFGEFIQHDAAINPGSSGGPLLNTKGEIIGINTLKLSATSVEGMGFSIPINFIEDILPYLENGIKRERVLLGVNTYSVKDILNARVDEEITLPDGIKHGSYVFTVADESFAKSAGIISGDIITHFNGVKLDDILGLNLTIELRKIFKDEEKDVEVIVLRGGVEIPLTIKFK